MIVVPAASELKTLADLVAKLKADPGSVAWGGGSAGGTDHILAGLIAKAAGADVSKLNYVPFSGGGEALAAVMGGHVAAGISGYSEWAGQIKSGELRALAISAPERVAGIESRRSRNRASMWNSPTGAPSWRLPASTKRRKRRLLDTSSTPRSRAMRWKKMLADKNWTDLYLPGDEFAKLLKAENARVTEILKGIGLVQ